MTNKYMDEAAEEASWAVRSGRGGPFGAVIVRNGKIIAKAHNTVVFENDPTAHAEINAIRAASQKLKRLELGDCELYTSCEPCPMCLAAAYWARIGKIYYGCTRDDARKIGFDDKRFYDIMEGNSKKGQIKTENIDRKECLKAFELWKNKKDKVRY
jgi:guanine deaminase